MVEKNQDSVEWLLLLACAVHLVVCPFTKVEESFNLQAIHDIIYHRTNISNYDHLEFPGVVPRSFVGPLMVALFAGPWVAVSTLMGLERIVAQFVVRAVLGTMVACAYREFSRALQKEFGSAMTNWLTLLTVSQFHFVFYMSRPLPNTFALIFVFLAYCYWLEQRHFPLIVTSGVAVLIFRAELASLLGIIILMEIFSGRLSILNVFKWGIPIALALLGTTIAIDSYFWQRWLWPEGEVLWFNVVLNKSSEWGTSPWSWYLYSAIPRALGSSLLLIPIGVWVDRRVKMLLLPAVGYVLLYSFLPHKELRFIIYILPLLNVAAARACLYFHNYPGGYALKKLHEIEAGLPVANIHIDVFAAQTGVSRFGELNPHWRYNKTENLVPGGLEMQSFTHLILEGKSMHSSSVVPYRDTHELLATVDGYSHVRLNYATLPLVHVRTRPRVLILRRKVSPTQVILDLQHKRSAQV
ncbi:dol-P-Man:Man(7)GlcNAc(2)-PP-Dol alpha-1,6-mannosyltransferase isoform X2 [Dermacentor andersoni]|uniref:dol-P-Man:Man(7)GlcNAc(2)-PP-Dol alpha-1,6-mannosyltransferase isoform X2 n=1 Tax=Dermacentor andersoni TaxID=34620 RepID=UPI002417BEC1|nr:probable Dol-P-Man:Man(7)GlcNAc(2)-PP-Dol alpha-1,6-mannosyltransferase isoform X2 [Dermacentor andersoni]